MMLDATTKLLDDFKRLPGRVARPRTFMEIAGYPYLENVCSNILAFFMDPEESHGLGNLVLDALLSTGRSTDTTEVLRGNISVEREVSTSKGRIDILITSENHAILVENKIHAGVNNPFDDYSAHLNQLAEGREKRKFLLTLYPTDEGSEWDFENLTHEDLVSQTRSLLGRYVSDADTRYLTIFLDFLNTLENLRRETRMNPEFVNLLAERRDDITKLFDDLKDFRNELRSKVQELESMIDVSQHENVNQSLWRGPTVSMSDVLYQDIPLSRDLPVAIDTVISPNGWRIQVFVRRGGDKSKLRNLLRHLEIPFEERGRFDHPTHFAYDEDLNRISPLLQDIVDKIAMSQEHKDDLDPA